MKNSDLKKKKKKRFENAYRNKRNFSKHAQKLSFFHIYKKNGVEVKFEPTPILTMQSNDLSLYQLS